MQKGHMIMVRGVKSANNINSIDNQGYNGRYQIIEVVDEVMEEYVIY